MKRLLLVLCLLAVTATAQNRFASRDRFSSEDRLRRLEIISGGGAWTDPNAGTLWGYYEGAAEGDGSATDESGNGNHCVDTGAVTNGVYYGFEDTAASYYSLPSAPDWSNGGTVALWLNMNANENAMFIEWQSSDTDRLWAYGNSSGQLGVQIRRNGSAVANFTALPGVVTGAWEHIVITVSNNAFYVYQNGAQIASDTAGTWDGWSDLSSADSWGGTPTWVEACLIDCLRIYESALTSNNVNDLYLNGPQHN